MQDPEAPPPTPPPGAQPTPPAGAQPTPPVPPPPGALKPRPQRRATVVEVTVSGLDGDQVEVRLADGRPGVFPARELDSPPEPGDILRAAVLARTDAKRRINVSVAWARAEDAWDRLEEAAAAGEMLRGPVLKSVKGGMVVDLGVRAFLPRSLVGTVEPGSAELIGTEVDVVVHEIDRDTERLVVSRRDAQRRQQRRAAKEAWAALEVGQTRTARVISVQDHGARVALEPLVGLVHRNELTWGHLGHPSEIVSVGDEIEVLVLEVSRSKRRVALSMRQVGPHPFEGIEVDQVLDATVVRVLDYGAFVRLDDSGAEGLVHVSELSVLPHARADQLVVPGESLRVKVMTVDRERNRLALSARRAAEI